LITGKQSYPTPQIEVAEPAPRASTAADRGRWIVRLLWVGVACSVVGMAIFLPFGWDGKDYLAALHGDTSLAYSPLFIKTVVGVARLLPLWLAMALFWFAYFSGWLTQLWVGMQCATPGERRIFRYVAQVIVFFPGLLVGDVIASGNLAYILYGLMLGAATLGWKRERWNWFYLAVLLAACVKVHLLTMLAIPLLCGRRQWMRTIVTAVTGLSLYALQSRIWPQAFHVYMNSLKIMSQSGHDFGCGPAGCLAHALQSLGVSHEKPCIVFYAIYAVALLLLLLWLSRLYREQRVCFESWAPVMLLGVVLLDPRILPYDFAAVSLPMAIIAWRALRLDRRSKRRSVLIGAAVVLIVALNALVIVDGAWKMIPDVYIEMFLMVGIFAAGVRGLLREAGMVSLTSTAYDSVPESELV
jgi:hypothetical protein